MADLKKVDPQSLAVRNPVLAHVENKKQFLTARLPKGIDKERFFLSLLTAIRRSKATAQLGKSLADCDPNSVLLAAYEAAEVGCNLSPSLQMGWLIPYNKEAQFQPSYRFFIQKAYETGEVKTFFAEVVYEGDELNRQYAPKKNLFHAPGTGPRTKETAIGAYSLIEFTDGTIDWEYMTAEQIGRHRQHSKQPNSLMWTTFWEEAFRKTPIRVMAKRLPIRNRNLEGLVDMINRDTEQDGIVTTDDISDITQPQRASESKQTTEPEKAKEQPKEQPKEQAEQTEPQTQTLPKQQENGKPKQQEQQKQQTQKQGEGQPGMFADNAMPTAEEQGKFWNQAFEAGWGKPQVIELIKETYNANALKELTKSQLESTLSTIRESRE